MLVNSGKLVEGLKCFEKLIELDPSDEKTKETIKQIKKATQKKSFWRRS